MKDFTGEMINLSYYIDFTSDDEEEKLTYEDCVVGLEQILPAGVYASHDEIKDKRSKELIDTIFQTPVNIELPANNASPIRVQLFSIVKGGKIHIYIPVHARYHRAKKGGGTVRNIIPSPELYVMCSDKRLDVCDFPADGPENNFCKKDVSKELCPWKQIPATMVTDTLFLDVPIGNIDHYYMVAWGTTVVIVVGSLYLLKTIHRYKVDTEKKIRKKLKT
ncbi:phosphatidylinositol-glycan biosynthesis class X protein-like isoform X2 [Vanessa cardui]|uniref:phosphatidylinositol-glycan biosynthesis class X protein-like isoform X2 n=1 Tax=Vanessa cardui TaxID=171605 RepID=UPI001F13F142|nr:phosphatidylinositol-glycan biosynthesis class X protein-like isoform X2 [Vanessa cardui]